jgi:UDP:flavonoid glycosyltransferase YjiC (YdhE family)
MHITILALGSHGDVWPYAVLGGALRKAGHDVRLATFESFAPMAAQCDLDMHPVEGDAASLLQTGGGLALSEAGRNIPRMLLALRRSFGAQAEAYGRAFGHPVLRETDVIVNQLPGGLYATDLVQRARLDGTPVALVHGSVMPLARTSAFPMLAFPRAPSFIPGYNALTYRIAEQLVWQMFRRAVNTWRRAALGLPPAPFLGNMGLHGSTVLNAFSRHVVPRPPDWGDNVHVTGYWYARDEEDWQAPDNLRRFLDAGPPPVFVGFGSMPLRRPKETTALLLEAVRRSGQRAILHAGWAGLPDDSLPEDVLAVGYTPYGWLFPRVAAVVHHGGAGTTGAALRAGVPALIMPFLFDQFFWGHRLQELGVGPAPLPFKKLAVPALATALRRMVQDETMRRRAARLAEKVRAEPGVLGAVKLIEGVNG